MIKTQRFENKPNFENYNKKLIMNHKQFFKEGKWMPSFILFGNREVFFHHPITAEDQIPTINRIILNPTYPAQLFLAQKLSKQTYSLTTNLRLHPHTSYQLKITHLRNMMQHVVKAADKQTQSYHNILYLTLKYLAHVVTRQAILKSTPIEDQVTIENWLADIHSIYFQPENVQLKTEDLTVEQQLLALLKKGDYEQMISKLRLIYCTTDQNDKETLQKIDLIITMLLIKLNSKASSQFLYKSPQQQLKHLPQKLLQNTKQKFTKLCQNSSKKQVQKKNTNDIYITIGKILLGEENSIEKISQKSWPLYLMNYIGLGNLKPQKQQSLCSIAGNYVNKCNYYGKTSQKQTEYFLFLLEGQNFHKIYQHLFEIVPPFYAHLIGYFFMTLQPSPIPNVFVQDYTLDIMRNLLDHASQISFQCLVLIYANFEENSPDERLNQIFQTLLFHHLNVVDSSDRNEMKDFLQKVRILTLFNLERYAYSQLNLLLNKQLQRGVISREVILIYANCSMLFYNYYNYEELLAYYLENLFMTFKLNIDFVQEYKNLKNNLHPSRDKKLLKELNKIQPLFDKFNQIQRILNEQNINNKISQLIELMQKTYRSLAVLEITSNLLESVGKDNILPHNSSQYRYFLHQVNQFLLHYPLDRGEPQHAMIESLQKMIA